MPINNGSDAQTAFMMLLAELRETRRVLEALSRQMVVAVESQGSLAVEMASLSETLAARREGKLARAAGVALDSILGLPPKKKRGPSI